LIVIREKRFTCGEDDPRQRGEERGKGKIPTNIQLYISLVY